MFVHPMDAVGWLPSSSAFANAGMASIFYKQLKIKENPPRMRMAKIPLFKEMAF
jgi:hypothetical protein